MNHKQNQPQIMKPFLLACPILLVAPCPAALAQTDFTKTAIDAGNNIGGVAWMDYDGDGLVDLAVAKGVCSPGGFNALFRNNGGNGFSLPPPFCGALLQLRSANPATCIPSRRLILSPVIRFPSRSPAVCPTTKYFHFLDKSASAAACIAC